MGVLLERRDDAVAYATSPDGVAWSQPTDVTPTGTAPTGFSSIAISDFSAWISGPNVYYVLSSGGGTNAFLYGYGTIGTTLDGSVLTGTITWTLQQGAQSTTATTMGPDSITADSDGNVWFALYTQAASGPPNVEVYNFDLGSSASPSWTLEATFSGSASFDGSTYLSLVPLPADPSPEVGLIYEFAPIGGTVPINIVTTSVGSFAGQTPVTASPPTKGSGFESFSAVSAGDVVYVAAGATDRNAYFFKFTQGQSSVQDEQAISGGPLSTVPSASIEEGPSGSNYFVVFFSTGAASEDSTSTVDAGATWSLPLPVMSVETYLEGFDPAYASSPAYQFGVVGTDEEDAPCAGLYCVQFGEVSLSPPPTTVQVSVTLSPAAGTTDLLSLTNYFTITYTSSGTTEVAIQAGGTVEIQVDPSTTVSISAASSGSSFVERWCLYLCSPNSFSSGASGTSQSLTYYQQYAELVSCAGGQESGAPNILYSSAGLPLGTELSTTQTPVFMDAGSMWSVANPAFDSNAQERWLASPSTSTITSGSATAGPVQITGTVSQSGVIQLVYYQQYAVEAAYSTSDGTTIPSSIFVTGTSAGVSGVQTEIIPTAFPVWLDAGSSFTVAPETVAVSTTEQYVGVSGTFAGTVSGPGLTIDPFYAHQFLVTFEFSTDPDGTNSITVDGTVVAEGANLWETAGTVLSISVTNPAEFTSWASSSASNPLADANSPSTTVTINAAGAVQADIVVNVVPVTFIASGLISGGLWSVTLNGNAQSSTNGAPITFLEVSDETYTYSIPCSTGGCPTLASGSVSVTGSGAQVYVTFVSIEFHEIGLTSGTSWSVTLDGQTMASSSSAIVFPVPDGQYSYSVACVSGNCPVRQYGSVSLSGETQTVYTIFTGPWPEYIHDSQHTGQSVYDGPLSSSVEWAFVAGDGLDDTGHVCTESTYECIAASEIYNPTVGPGGVIYFTTNGAGTKAGTTDRYPGNLFALNPDGSLDWVAYTDGFIDGSTPVIGTDGDIYIGTSQSATTNGVEGTNSLLAFTPGGTLLWNDTFPSDQVGGLGYQSVAVAPDGMIYAPVGDVASNLVTGQTYTGYLDEISPAGDVVWSLPIGSAALSSPVIGPSGDIYMVGDVGGQNTLFAFTPNGVELWNLPVSSGGPTIGPDGTIYVGCSDAVCAYNPDSSLDWKTTLPVIGSCIGQEYANTPGFTCDYQTVFLTADLAVGADGIIYAATEQKSEASKGTQGSSGYIVTYLDGPYTLFAINADGSLDWSLQEGNPIPSAPTIGADGTVYLDTEDGIHAIDAAGSEIWNGPGIVGPETGGFVSGSPAIGPDGTLYVGTLWGELIAIGPGPTQSTLAGQITGGSGSASFSLGSDQGSISITGASSSDGSGFTLTAEALGGQDTGTGVLQVGSPAQFFDVEVTGVSGGTAQVCISTSVPTDTMDYWSGVSWLPATEVSNPAPDEVCGSIPVSALTGTPIVIGQLQADESPQIQQPIAMTMAGSAPTATVTVDGCDPSPSTFPADGSEHTIEMNPSCSFSLSFSNSGSARDGFAISGLFASDSPTYDTCASGTCGVVSLTAFGQVETTYAATFAGGDAPPGDIIALTGSYLGSPATLGTLDVGGLPSAIVSAWSDYGAAVSYSSVTALSGTAERWVSSSPFSTGQLIAGGYSFTVNYYNQYLLTIAYSTTGGSATQAPVFSADQFGISMEQDLTATPTGYWFDAGSSWTVTESLPSSSPGQQWTLSQADSGTVMGAETINFAYLLSSSSTTTSSSSGGSGVPQFPLGLALLFLVLVPLLLILRRVQVPQILPAKREKLRQP